MTKLWAKIVIEHKVKRSYVHDNGAVEIDADNFHSVLISICENLKIPTPIVTQSQLDNLLTFNILKLKQRDFIESIPFDILEFNAFTS